MELVHYLFSLPDVECFLSQEKDPLENFFGCRQRGGVHDNPNAQEFCKNTQALRVINSVARAPKRGNCRGKTEAEESRENNTHAPLPKRPQKSSILCK